MILRKLRQFLDALRVQYMIIHHVPAFTAQEIAAKAHVPGNEMIKTVMVKVDGRMMMVAVPASAVVDLERLRISLKARTVELASEREFRNLFPDCEVGAMPPLGEFWNVGMVMSRALLHDKYVAFNAGTHRDVIQMAFEDYRQLAHPQVVRC